MYRLLIVIGLVLFLMGYASATGKLNTDFSGRYCDGSGDAEFLKLVDESFQFFHAGENVPNLTMLYQPDWDTFAEGAGWGAWWIQNSYGFSYCATPFLQEPWISILQKSWDLHWSNQGDGKRVGMWGGSATANVLSSLQAPDGALGDCARPGEIVYKQGDGDMTIHDWFYEGTAAGVVMEAEILLRNHDVSAVKKYLPNMERACECIEKTRDPKNNLFLVGAAANLLAPSYGGVKLPDGTFGKGYLAGLSITYTAALDRMVELYKMVGDKTKLETYQHRLKITRDSLKLLQTDKGYFVKSIEPDGTKHGVIGQAKYGYMEGVANADALAFRVTDDKSANRIYDQIAAYKDIRPFDFLMTNAPSLDDTYVNWGKTDNMPGFYQYGQWVNGGVWATVEGRAIMGYYRLNKFDDVRRSSTRAMKWAKDFRMDAPWSQCGENTSNAWSDTGSNQVGGVAVMVDNFAIPAATVRGLFEYIYKADSFVLYPHIPQSVTSYIQKEPVWFGGKSIYLSIANGPGAIKSVKVNGKSVKVSSADHFSLSYADLPTKAEVEIIMEGAAASISPSSIVANPRAKADVVDMPDTLKKPYAVLVAMSRQMRNEQDADYERVFINEAIESIEAWRCRAKLDPGPGYFRAITPERRDGIQKFYENAALTMYSGFISRMQRYANSDNLREKHIAELFANVKAEVSGQ
jgi:hypothetical protein